MDLKTVKARWGWATLLTLIVGAALGYMDGRVKAASGYGILDLEFVNTAEAVATITGAWQAAGVADEMGFLLGLDYLYMVSYGFALFYGSLAAREAFAKSPGPLRSILTVLAFAPLAGAALDVIENAGEARFLFVGVQPDIAYAIWCVTLVKFAGVLIGLALALAGVAGLLMGRLKTA